MEDSQKRPIRVECNAEKLVYKRILLVGALSNGLFAVLGGLLTILQSLLAMRILGPREMGEFAVAAAIAATLELISDFGIGDRLVQQKSLGLPAAFHAALTFQTIAAVPVWAAAFFTAPLLGQFYGLSSLPGLIRLMSFQAFAGVLRLPLFLIYRDLNYVQHRFLLFLGKAVSFVITLTLAWLGYGAWSLAWGIMAGLLATCIPAWILVAQLPGWRFRHDEMSLFLSFCWPVWASRLSMIAVEQGSVFVISVTLSVQQLGQYKSAEQIAHTAPLVEMLFAQTIYPLLCRATESRDELSKLFSAATRGAMIFVAAASCFLVIFPHQIVELILTDRWKGAELFLQAHGIGILLGAVAFNWEAIFRALGDTRPIFRLAIIYAVSFLTLLCPLTYFFGKPGAAAGVVLVNLVAFVVRQLYFNRLGLKTSILRLVWPPAITAAGAMVGVAALRWLLAPAVTFTGWALEISVYVAIYLICIWRVENELIGSLIDLLRRRNLEPSLAHSN